LGRFILDGIPPAPRGMPQIEVSFDVDANGILAVKAKDKASGKEQSIRIEARSGLTEDEIKKMQADATAHEAEDEKKKEEIETKNIAEQMIYTAEKAIKDNGAKVTPEIVKGVEDKIADLKKAKEGADMEAIKKASEALTTEMQKIGEAMSKASSESGQATEPAKEGGESAPGSENPSTGSGPNGKDENIKDADFTEGAK
jgi:molecular chaperone DnaK